MCERKKLKETAQSHTGISPMPLFGDQGFGDE
jgi:hypothetical protein